MDLVQQANALKNLSDQQLQMVTRDQSVPPYLVVSEMKRREEMRKAGAEQQGRPPQSTVAQQVMGQFQQGMQPRPPMGGGPPPGAPPQGIMGAMPQQQNPMGGFNRPTGMMPPPQMGGAPQGPPPQMRSGGIVAFAEGGLEENPDGFQMPEGGILAALTSAEPAQQMADNPYSWIPRVPDSVPDLPTTVEEYQKRNPRKRGPKEANDFVSSIEGPDYLGPIAAKIAQLEAQMRSRKPGNSLMALGLGMAASRNPTFAGALGEGGLGALQRYDQQKKEQEAMAMQLLDAQAATVRAQQQRAEQHQNNALRAWEKQGAEENTMQAELGANARALARIKAERDTKNGEIEQKYQENLKKLNQPDAPDTPTKLAVLASDPTASPERRRMAAESLKLLERHSLASRPVTNVYGAGDPSIGRVDQTLTGDAFLEKLPKPIAARVKAIAEGRDAIPTGRAATTGAGAQIANAVYQYDPGFSTQRAQVRKSFTSGKDATNIRALNTSAVHLDALGEAAEAMKNGNFTPGNQAYNKISAMLGRPAPTSFEALRAAVNGELAAGLKGTATDIEIRNIGETTNRAGSPEQLAGMINTHLHTIGQKLNTYHESYQQQVKGDKSWSPVLPTARAVFTKHGYDPTAGPDVNVHGGPSSALPSVGADFQGGKVLKITKVQ